MKLQCSYCGQWFENTDYEKGETFKGIDEHHNPPKFLTSEKEWFNFEGKELLNLCREHHRKLHDEILIILNRIAGTLKFNRSEYWLTQKLSAIQKQQATKEVFEYTRQWISQKN